MMFQRFRIASLLLALLATFPTGRAEKVSVAQLELKNAIQEWAAPGANRTVDGHPLTIGGKPFTFGVGGHAASEMNIQLDGRALRFTAKAGLDDETLPDHGSVEFFLVADRNVVWKSGIMHTGDPAKAIDVSLAGVKALQLGVSDGGDGNKYDHADWAEAIIEYAGLRPRMIPPPSEDRIVLTPPAAPEPRINGAKIYGARPGSPILYKIAASGAKPMKYAVDQLPKGLSLDAEKGILTGSVAEKGTYEMVFHASNSRGEAARKFRLVIGDQLALTPPMGWNSWNVFGTQVDQKKVEAAAQALISSGLIDYGWSFINVDDAWSNAPASKAPLISGPSRHDDGSIVVNKKFPDMKAMVDAIHAEGLKVGIYSSPGPLTCGGFVGSFGFEEEDARQYAQWGIDYLKYDWCGYQSISEVMTRDLNIDRLSRLDLQPPYREMNGYLRTQPRDIVYSLCQYGMGDVSQWGASVGGQLWRTTGDISDSWASMSGIGFGQAGLEKYAGPGHWNDPDMLVVGHVGLQGNYWNTKYDKPNLYESRLTPNEQYTHVTLWCMLAAPLLIGCDMTQMDAFTQGLLTNAEVIDIDQDSLGRQASRISQNGLAEIWARPLDDGSVAIALFNRAPYPMRVQADLRACGVTENGLTVRDVWRQRDLGPAGATYSADVPRHGTVLIRIYKK